MPKINTKASIQELLKGKKEEERQAISQHYVTQLRGMLKAVEYLADYLSVDEFTNQHEQALFDNWRQEAEKKADQLEKMYKEMNSISEEEIDFLLKGCVMLTLVPKLERKKGLKSFFFGDLEKAIKRAMPPKALKSGHALIKHLN